MIFQVGSSVYLRGLPHGEPGTVIRLRHRRVIVLWGDLDFTARHAPASLVEANDSADRYTSVQVRAMHLPAGSGLMKGTEGKMANENIEDLMRDLVATSTALKRALYKYDQSASTSPEGVEGPVMRVHICQICRRMAAGENAQIKHRSGCELAKLQFAQKRLRAVWPELFEAVKPKQKAA